MTNYEQILFSDNEYRKLEPKKYDMPIGLVFLILILSVISIYLINLKRK